jgi:branched-chain amino acid transport system ATP-binding protein
MSVLRLEGVGRTFGGVRAVDGLSFEVRPGFVTGLIGPNGAGKTTVINLVTGIYRLDAGRVLFGETDITAFLPHKVARCGIARTFQNIRLLKEQTVLENVLIGFHRREKATTLDNIFFLKNARTDLEAFKSRAEELLKQFDIIQFRDFPAGALSYGHQRRVEIVRALAADPTLLILDEPAAGMNDVEADAIGRIFRALAAAGVAVLLVEHNMHLVMSICETIHVIDAGKYVMAGSAADVANDPRVISAYLGS